MQLRRFNCLNKRVGAGGTKRDEVAVMLPTIPTDVLVGVIGGNATNEPAFGRCGPADRWKVLGNVYTPQCLAHDTVVRNARAAGASRIGAQLAGLPLLPAAIGSYAKSVMTGGTSSGSR